MAEIRQKTVNLPTEVTFPLPHMYRSPWHIVDPSPWPLTGAIGAFGLVTGLIAWFHNRGFFCLALGLGLVLLTIVVWWRDVIREATFIGCHTSNVQDNLIWGIGLFILSEAFFFFSFFWAFFHRALAPTIQIGCTWPPVGIEAIGPWGIPILNTALLLGSGVYCTWAQAAVRAGNLQEACLALVCTLAAGIYFTRLQVAEYYTAPFTVADRVYGSVFFVTTGFHGLHVIIGSAFLFVNLVRTYRNHFSTGHHLGLTFAAWYWHFVDVIWILLYLSTT